MSDERAAWERCAKVLGGVFGHINVYSRFGTIEASRISYELSPSLRDRILSLADRAEALRAENATLAAGQCREPIAGDGGSMECGAVNRLHAELAAAKAETITDEVIADAVFAAYKGWFGGLSGPSAEMGNPDIWIRMGRAAIDAARNPKETKR